MIAREEWQHWAGDEYNYGKSLNYIAQCCLSESERCGLSEDNILMLAVDDKPWVWKTEDNNAGSVLFVEPWIVASASYSDFRDATKHDTALHSLRSFVEQWFNDPSKNAAKLLQNMEGIGG